MRQDIRMEHWPFADPPNVITFTLRSVIEGAPILLVCHDVDDGGWQFLTGESIDMANALLVTLHSIVNRDASIAELADLPIGWQAEREHKAAPWKRRPIGDSAA